MIKFALAATAALAAVPAFAAGPSLAGVAERETTITGPVTDYVTGRGDVMFVRDRTHRWYRVGLNQGCMTNIPRINALAFGASAGWSPRIDRFTRVHIDPSGGGFMYTCRIQSIRRSEAPPQRNSRSPVTLD